MVIKWMFTADAPLLVNPMPSWHKLSWFMEFMANIPDYEKNTIATTKLAIEARKHLLSWAETEKIDFDHKKEGILHIYRKKENFDHSVRVSELLAKGGLPRRQLSPSEISEIEPTLAGQYHGGFFTETDSTGDIHKFTHGLAAAAERRGVKFIYSAEVIRTSASDQGVVIAFNCEGAERQLQADAVVVCAGIGSRHIAKMLGDRINVYPVKGYSITVNLTDELSQKSAPHVSLLDDETKLVTSRLGLDRFRVAGTAEFNGANRNIRMDRIRPLVEWVNQCFPGVNTRSVIPWAGLRPMLPSMLPKVGKGTRKRVFYNTGHGHLGWTLSAATAELIAEAVDTAWSTEKIYS